MPCHTMTAIDTVIGMAPHVDGNGMDLGEEVTITTNRDQPDASEADVVGNIVDDILTKISSDTGNCDEIVIEDDSEVSEMSPSKRRKDATDSMDVDANDILSSEDKENLTRCVKRISRKELEDLVLVKVVDSIVQHSQAGKLRMKVGDLQTQKDRLFQRVGHLQKQVQEMSRALKLLIDNHNRDPNNLDPNKKRPPPIKFFRSVGLQVAIEPPYRNGPTKVIHVNNEQPMNGLKMPNGAAFNASPSPQSVRRGSKGNDVSGKVLQGNNLTQQYVRIVNGQQTSRVTTAVSVNSSQTSGVLKNTSRQQTATTIQVSPAKANNLTSPTVVDLTEDPNAAQQSSVLTTANGVQYRILNPSNQSVQFLPTSQAYQMVSHAGQVRPYILAQNLSTVTAQQQRPVQALLLRNVAPKQNTSTTFAQTRPSLTVRPASSVVYSSGASPKVAATIGTMMRAPSQAASVPGKKFQLPPLPPMTTVNVQRGRALKDLPPRPALTLTEQADGIVLSWTMKLSPMHADIGSYQIFACQESLATSPGKVSQWKKVGDVKALPLPMACTLSQFTQGNRYFFIVRALDGYSRTGQFCEPAPIMLQKRS